MGHLPTLQPEVQELYVGLLTFNPAIRHATMAMVVASAARGRQWQSGMSMSALIALALFLAFSVATVVSRTSL